MLGVGVYGDVSETVISRVRLLWSKRVKKERNKYNYNKKLLFIFAKRRNDTRTNGCDKKPTYCR